MSISIIFSLTDTLHSSTVVAVESLIPDLAEARSTGCGEYIRIGVPGIIISPEMMERRIDILPTWQQVSHIESNLENID